MIINKKLSIAWRNRLMCIPTLFPSKIDLMATFIILIVLMLGLNWRALRGYPAPNGTVELESPLRNGRFLVLNGGSSPEESGNGGGGSRCHTWAAMSLHTAQLPGWKPPLRTHLSSTWVSVRRR